MASDCAVRAGMSSRLLQVFSPGRPPANCHTYASKLPESAVYFWRRELQRRQAEPQRPTDLPATPAFVAVRVEDSSSSSIAGRPNGTEYRIEIELPGGRRVHVVAPVDRQTLADVLAVLEGRPC